MILETFPGVRVLRAAATSETAFTPYVPHTGGAAGQLRYGTAARGRELSSVQWLYERHICSLGVPLSAGLFRMEVSEFDFDFVAEETMIFLAGSVELTMAGDVIGFGPGDMTAFDAGVSTHWQVLEPTILFFTLLD